MVNDMFQTVNPLFQFDFLVFLEKEIPLPAKSSIEVHKQGENETPVWLIKNDRWYLFWTGYAVEETPSALKVTAKVRFAHLAGIALFGFGLGGTLVFVGGLIAIDICSKRASGRDTLESAF